MFNKDFYPTPGAALYSMDIDCQNKIVLEPSAGKGNIVEFLKEHGAKEVLTCESNVDLAEIVKTKSKFLIHDFLKLTPEQISHVELIVMNPPFSNGVKHVLHAWEIAPAGCEIISLLNHDNLENDYTRERKEFLSIIKSYGNETNLGDVFSDAERKTGVSIGLVKLFKPGAGNNEFEGFFLEEDVEEWQENGIMKFDGIRDVVQRYIGAVKLFDEHSVIADQMSKLTAPFSIGTFSIEVGYGDKVADRETFKKELQKKAWGHLFNLMNLNKFVTSGVMKDINRFVEQQNNVPFTMKNIYKMFDIIIGTRGQVFDRALEESVDKFTMHTDENRFNVEGWKTNAGYMLNKKFIINYMFEPAWTGGKLSIKYSGNEEKLKDLTKVLCSLVGENYDELTSLHYVPETGKNSQFTPNEWYNWDFKKTVGEGEFAKTITRPGFFEFKGFKKGTMHIKFRDPKVWEILNRRYAKIKGQVLPEKFRI